ncbi:MAG: PfkB family carbohydrate kinase [Candidatus Bathyarchaeota archaeon]
MTRLIVNVGSISLDTTRTPFKTVTEILGGSGTFFSIASSFFDETGLVGVVGSDFPEKYLKLLGDRINLAGLKVEKGKTFRFDSSFGYDLGVRTTNKTELNVFGKWSPLVPDEYRGAEYLYLGNVSPRQQLDVLDQMNHPKLTIADTIEFWIKNNREELIEVISRVDGVVLNYEEVRQLCETPNIFIGARTIMDWGADLVVVKKGEHGSILFNGDTIFPTCGFPLEKITDPTGAGDCFAGGLMGHIARSGRPDNAILKEAVVYGNVMGSFAVEEFGVDRFLSLSLVDIERRYSIYKTMVTF